MSQFFYKRIENVPTPQEGGGYKMEKVTVYDSFSLEKVLRSLGTKDGTTMVFLDDGHEETREAERKRPNGKVETIKERSFYHSQIELDKEDSARFRNQAEWRDFYSVPPVTFTTADAVSTD